METIAKRAKHPVLSSVGEHLLAQYERRLRVEEDLSSATIRNYLSDLRQFIAWWESLWQQGCEDTESFTPEAVTILIELKRWQEALDACNQTLSLNPTAAWVWGNKGNALNNLKRSEEA